MAENKNRLFIAQSIKIEGKDGHQNDLLNRKPYGEKLLNILEFSPGELVIALNGRWGDGKTTFVQMWQKLLDIRGIPNIYIDAFANDYLEDAFLVFSRAIIEYANKKIGEDQIKNLKEVTKNVGKFLMPLATKTLTTMLGLGSFSGDISELIKKLIGEKIDPQDEEKKEFEAFKQELTDLPGKLNKSKDGEDTDSKPLIIIVDELDRCKPTFAIQMLEKIKHLFAVKNVVFVLVMNKEQLEESIKCVYGQGIDATMYLQKFIHLETQLPKQLWDYFVSISDVHKFIGQFVTTGKDISGVPIHEIYSEFLIPLNLTLRQLERVFIYYNLLKPEHTDIFDLSLMLFFATIKVVKPQLFDKFLRQEIPKYSELAKELNFPQKTSNFYLMIWIYAFFLPDDGNDIVSELQKKNPESYKIFKNCKMNVENLRDIKTYLANFARRLNI